MQQINEVADVFFLNKPEYCELFKELGYKAYRIDDAEVFVATTQITLKRIKEEKSFTTFGTNNDTDRALNTSIPVTKQILILMDLMPTEETYIAAVNQILKEQINESI